MKRSFDGIIDKEIGTEVLSLNKRKTGTDFEEKAAAYLAGKGYVIKRRNYRAGRGPELDIVAWKDGMLIGVECKYRSGLFFGDPLEAVDLFKQKRICRAMLRYYAEYGYSLDVPCRFDVIAIYGDGSVRHIENAFEFQV